MKNLKRIDFYLIIIIIFMIVPVAFAVWQTTYSKLTTLADGDAFLVADLSDPTMDATYGTTKYIEWSDIKAALSSFDVLEIPNDANPTVDAQGEIAWDSTDEQLIVYGTAVRVFKYEFTECVVVENLAAADDNYEIWMANDAVTITGIGVHCRGTCTTGADISLEDRSGNAMTHTTPTHSTGTGNTTWQSVTAANTLVAGEGLAFDVDNAVSPETDEYTICFTYSFDRQ